MKLPAIKLPFIKRQRPRICPTCGEVFFFYWDNNQGTHVTNYELRNWKRDTEWLKLLDQYCKECGTHVHREYQGCNIKILSTTYFRVTLQHKSPFSYMGRFGGGWNWRMGFQCGKSDVIFNLLFFSIWVSWGLTYAEKQRRKGLKKDEKTKG